MTSARGKVGFITSSYIFAYSFFVFIAVHYRYVCHWRGRQRSRGELLIHSIIWANFLNSIFSMICRIDSFPFAFISSWHNAATKKNLKKCEKKKEKKKKKIKNDGIVHIIFFAGSTYLVYALAHWCSEEDETRPNSLTMLLSFSLVERRLNEAFSMLLLCFGCIIRSSYSHVKDITKLILPLIFWSSKLSAVV